MLTSDGEPVTVMIARRVAVGREGEFQAWADRLSETLSSFPGCLGTGWLRPSRLGEPWHLVFRFDNAEHLHDWETSPERAGLVRDAEHFVETTGVHRVSGLETWFSLPGLTVPAPPKWKMFLVSGTVFYLLNVLLATVYGRAVLLWVVPLRVLVISFPVTALATWVVLPQVVRFLRGWLYRASSQRR